MEYNMLFIEIWDIEPNDELMTAGFAKKWWRPRNYNSRLKVND